MNELTPNSSVQAQSENPIGVFDSGVGGLSIFSAIRQLLPTENILYIADQAHVPYGTRTLEEIRLLSDSIVHFFLTKQVKLTVVACNTASAAALHFLREKYPDHTFVGMEPAVKPAAQATHTRCVGVLATQATFQGELYASVLERFAKDVKVFENTCPGLVSQIEKGDLNSPETHRILEAAIHPMLKQGVDTIVLGCTHYPFVIPLIRMIAGTEIDVIDPSPAIARQTKRLLEEKQLDNRCTPRGKSSLFTTKSPAEMQKLLPKLIGEEITVHFLKWKTDGQGALHLTS